MEIEQEVNFVWMELREMSLISSSSQAREQDAGGNISIYENVKHHHKSRDGCITLDQNMLQEA